MSSFETTKSNCYQDQGDFGVVPDLSSVSANDYDVHNSAEDNQFYNDKLDQIEPIDYSLKHLNNENFSMDWYDIALEDILCSAAGSNDTIETSIHAFFGNETMSLLEQELFFENEMTSFDIENQQGVTNDLTEERIFPAIGTENEESYIDNAITKRAVRSECGDVNNNIFDYVNEFNSFLENPPLRCETILAETNLKPAEENSSKEVDHVNECNSSTETPPLPYETILAETNPQSDEENSHKDVFQDNDFNSSLQTPEPEPEPSKTNLQPDEKILGENYVFEVQCTLCEKTLSASQCMSHICDLQIKPRETFSCKKCERTFYNKADLLTHEKIHFTCSICGRNLSRQFSLKRHYRLVHGKTNIIFI